MAVLPTPGSPMLTGLFLVELLLFGVRREVAPVLVELAGLGPLGLDPAAATGGLAASAAPAPAATAAETPDDLAPHLVRVDVEVREHARGDTLGLAHEAEQDVLGAYVVVAELQGFPEREFEHLLRARGERRLGAGSLFAVADDALDLLAHLIEGDVKGGERLGGHALVLAEEAEEQVLGAYVVVVEVAGFVLREHHDLTRPLRESFEHQRDPPPL